MKYLLLKLIQFYRKWISPLTPPRCKYYPTCSSYALQAIERHGALKGFMLSTWRLARCNPWSLGGIDHVPLAGHWDPGPSQIFSDENLKEYWSALDRGDQELSQEIVKKALREAQGAQTKEQ